MRPKLKATIHGARAVMPSCPRRWRTISAATKTMLSAMTASTGGGGIWTQPSVAAVSVRLWERVKAVTVFTSFPATARDDEQREHEEEMINSCEDVFDAEHGVSAGDFQSTGSGFHHEGRSSWSKPGDLGRAVETLQTHEHRR